MTLNELMKLIVQILPEAMVVEDSEGQVMIATGKYVWDPSEELHDAPEGA